MTLGPLSESQVADAALGSGHWAAPEQGGESLHLCVASRHYLNHVLGQMHRQGDRGEAWPAPVDLVEEGELLVLDTGERRFPVPPFGDARMLARATSPGHRVVAVTTEDFWGRSLGWWYWVDESGLVEGMGVGQPRGDQVVVNVADYPGWISSRAEGAGAESKCSWTTPDPVDREVVAAVFDALPRLTTAQANVLIAAHELVSWSAGNEPEPPVAYQDVAQEFFADPLVFVVLQGQPRASWTCALTVDGVAGYLRIAPSSVPAHEPVEVVSIDEQGQATRLWAGAGPPPPELLPGIG